MKYFLMPETSNDPRFKIKIGKKLLELSNIVEPGYSKTRGKRETYLLNLSSCHIMCHHPLEKILIQLGVTLQDYLGMVLMKGPDDEESVNSVSNIFEEANNHFNEALQISRYIL